MVTDEEVHDLYNLLPRNHRYSEPGDALKLTGVYYF